MTTLKELIQLKNEGKLRGAFHVSMKDYHAGPGISMSQLRNLKKSPKIFDHYSQVRMEQSYKMQEGVAFDAWLGDKTPDKELFFKEVLIADCKDRKPKAWKEAAEVAKVQGKVPIPAPYLDTIKAMAKAIEAHPIACKLPTGSAQISFYWVDEETGVLCRCRPDFLPGDGTICDLKTTTTQVDKHTLSSVGTNLAYYLQSAFYLRGTCEAVRQQHELLGEELSVPPFESFKFLTVESTAPHDVAVSEYDDFSRNYANAIINKLLALYKKCADTNTWPGRHENKVVTLTVPGWLVNKGDDDE